MKKHLVGLVITLLTLCIGILTTRLRPSTAQHTQILVLTVPVTPIAPRQAFAGPWRKVRIGRVSFSMPAYLKKTGPPGNAGVIEAFGGAVVGQHHLYLNYSYGDTISSDLNKPYGQPSERLIDGKRATLYFADVERPLLSLKDTPVMKLVVLDVGDGQTKFELYLSGFDVELMRQIVDSVQIRS